MEGLEAELWRSSRHFADAKKKQKLEGTTSAAVFEPQA